MSFGTGRVPHDVFNKWHAPSGDGGDGSLDRCSMSDDETRSGSSGCSRPASGAAGAAVCAARCAPPAASWLGTPPPGPATGPALPTARSVTPPTASRTLQDRYIYKCHVLTECYMLTISKTY